MSFEPIPLEDWKTARQSLDFQGHKIAYWTVGEGRPLLLVHGYPTAAWDWSYMWDEMASTRRVIACDMLGFGFSDKPKAGYSIHRQADLQAALLSHLGVSDFDTVVHDYGVSVGQEILARRNEGTGFTGLGRICFLNGGLFPEQHRPRALQKLGISPFGWLLGYLVNRKRFGAGFSEVFGPETKPSEQELDTFWALMNSNGGKHRMHTLLHYIADRQTHRDRWVGALEHAQVPVKVVNGGQDPVSGKHLFDTVVKALPNVEAVLFEDIGHYPQTEAPERVFKEVVAFMKA
ncbi:MAG: alpha/beta hydrolase [Henriciella sp.]|nr:alpha/beta hydrolase [Henriciella sp.]